MHGGLQRAPFKMRCLFHICVGLLVTKCCSAVRSVNDFTDTGKCVGESHAGNSPFLPRHYSLYLDLNPELKNFRGEVNITGTLSEDTNMIVLHSVQLNVSNVRVNGMDLDRTSWYTDDMDHTNAALYILLENKTFGFNYDNLTVGVSYEGAFNETDGIIMQNYNETDKNRWIIFTHLEPDSARRVFPCIDLPRYKAEFDISINKTNFRGRTVLSNMPVESNDANVIKFQTSPLMSTYLVAFLVCDYVPLKYNSTGKRYVEKTVLTTWVPKEMTRDYGARFIRLHTPQILEALENYYGSPYFLPKLDMYVVMEKPGIGGMENWGLIMYQVDSFVQSKQVFANDQVNVVSTIAHELAHHWSGNSVTLADWCGVWLQESIPTFLSGLATQKAFSEMDDVNRVKWAARIEAMSEECGIPDPTPLRDEINMAGPSTLFVRAQYLKGANLLSMIESVVTPEVFKTSLRSLYETYNGSFANETDLWEMVDKSCGKGGFQKKFGAPVSLSEMANGWVTYPSHPIVVVERKENGVISLTQNVCLRLVSQCYFWIPISFTTSRDPDFQLTTPQQWITPAGENNDFVAPPTVLNIILAEEDWIILNIMGSGFYRVEYDDVTWDRLISQLEKDSEGDPNNAVIPPIHRAMLVDDSFHIAFTGKSLIKTFKILRYIKHETSNYVWEAIRESFHYSYDLFPAAEKELFKKYMQFLLKDVFKRVTVDSIERWEHTNVRSVEPINEKKLRETVLEVAYKMELPALYSFSRDIASKVMNKDIAYDKICPGGERWMWCAAVSTDEETFEWYLKRAYDSTKSRRQRNHIFKSLTCSKTKNEQLLNLILENNVGRSKVTLRADIMEFLLFHWPAGCKETLSFLKREKERLVDDESQWNEFRRRLQNPPSECKEEVETLFGPIEPTDDSSDEKWREFYGDEPLIWLQNHSDEWE